MTTVVILLGILILAVGFLFFKLWSLEEELIYVLGMTEKKKWNLLRFILCR